MENRPKTVYLLAVGGRGETLGDDEAQSHFFHSLPGLDPLSELIADGGVHIALQGIVFAPEGTGRQEEEQRNKQYLFHSFSPDREGSSLPLTGPL